MSDDWQDAAFSSRHMHNNRGAKSKRATFDVKKTFGSYEVKCPAWQRLDNASSEQASSLELYRLTESKEGVVGVLILPGALRAAVVLSGSRQSLRTTIESIEEDDDDVGEEEEEEEEEYDEPSSPSQLRFETFKKNSFRSPKFWFRWSGSPMVDTTPSSPKTGKLAGSTVDIASGLGYIVFAGNDCQKFKGTINCVQFGWRDVALTGHKIAARSELDVPVAWGKGAIGGFPSLI
ncbi:hypothetical protein BDU57DRAFT_524711 [Ampelomyces quisqualis]|uniref:Uncharacterized protein n=1 Tax=Ampelomyces quisqualis TaxID=50730 RepID=A0A6A5Q965_AMPQU|nr:hypothetical protein BDU57DRAFT_524711 [Ampelomyces quisqualis]